jgi:uncharacterized protein YkwD
MPKPRTKQKTNGSSKKSDNRGRPTSYLAMRTSIFIRCTEDQKAALKEYIDEINEDRAEKGLPRVDLSTWIRELALKHSGNEDLGMAAAALAAAKAAASIV